MKTWTELQEWVEVSAGAYATSLGQAHALEMPARLALEGNLPEWDELSDDERSLLVAAVAWKAAERLATTYENLASGWAEAYYRDLKRMYEEES